INPSPNPQRVFTGAAQMDPEETLSPRPAVEISTRTPERPARQEARVTPPIGRLLIEAGLIGETDLARALAFQQRYGGRLGSILVRLGAVSEERLMPIVANQLNLPLLGESDLPAETASYFEAIKTSGYAVDWWIRSEEHTSELQSRSDLVCRLLLEKKK